MKKRIANCRGGRRRRGCWCSPALQPRPAGAQERPRRVLRELVPLCAQLPRQPDPGRQAERHRLRVRVPDGGGHVRLSDPWSDYQAPTWSGTDSVDGVADDPSNPDQHLFGNFNQLAQAQGGASRTFGSRSRSAAGRARRTSPTPRRHRRRVRRSCSRASTCSSAATCPTGGWPDAGRRHRRGGRPLRRHQHRLGVPRHRSRQRRAPLAGRPPQRDAAAAGVPPPARRATARRPASTTR